MKLPFTLLLAAFIFFARMEDIHAQTPQSQTFIVTLVAAENGSYTIEPNITTGDKVKAGTVLTVNAKTAPGYALDAVYSTFKGGMWGTMSHEFFSTPTRITIDKDMSIGATFVKQDLIEGLNVTHDVVYAQPGIKPLKYDVFSPKGARNLPCIVIIHGGAWSSNNEDIMRGLARELAQGGRYVVFSIDYRWVNRMDGEPEATYMHELIEDVFGALAHIQEHASEYGADPTRIAVTGDSAGGHLAASAAVLSPRIGNGGFDDPPGVFQYMPTYLPSWKSVDQVRKEIIEGIKAVAPSYGPFDARHFKMFIEQTSEKYYDAVSPVKHVPHVSERAVPHFIVRGTLDTTVPHEVVEPYMMALADAEQRVDYIQVIDAGHAFFDWKPDAQTRATFAKYGVRYAVEMRAFFDTIFY